MYLIRVETTGGTSKNKNTIGSLQEILNQEMARILGSCASKTNSSMD